MSTAADYDADDPGPPAPEAPDVEMVALYCGLPLIPLGARMKRPTDAEWTTRSYAHGEAPMWAASGQNVGVRLADLRLLVLDFDPRNAGGRDTLGEFAKTIGLNLASPLRTYTGGGGLHLFYRLPESFQDTTVSKLPSFPGVEIKTSGQVVCAGSLHPETGQLYRPDPRFDFAEPRPSSALSLIPEAPAALLAAIRRPKAVATPRDPLSLDDLRYLLDGLDPVSTYDEGERDAWLRIGAAIHHETNGSEEGWSLFEEWSGRDERFATLDDGEKNRTAWESFGRNGDPVTGGTLVKLFRDAGGVWPRVDASEPVPMTGWGLSDVGNATRFAAEHADEIRYVEETKSWAEWNGRRWAPDFGLAAKARAEKTARRMAHGAVSIEDSGARSAASKWALSSLDNRKLLAMVDVAKPKLRASAVDFDRDSMLLNVANGTLDLRTHTLRPHDSADMLSKIAPTDHEPGARCPVWESFLERVLPDPDVRACFQRLMGYGLQGGQEAKCFGVVVGPPDAGKSTALDTIARALGCPGADAEEGEGAAARHYVETASVEAFGPHDGGNRPELAKLIGARLVLVNEIPEEGHGLESRTVKAWTGGDLLSAAPKYGHPITFRPDGLLVFMGNALPEIGFEDDAMWERVALIEFGVSIPEAERDRELRSKFDPRGVLAWLVEGHRLYRESGLAAPESCRLARDRRRSEADPLAEFWEAATEPEGFASRAALFGAYRLWADREGLPQRDRATRTGFVRLVNARSGIARGLRETAKAGVRGWLGVRIRAGFGGESSTAEL